MTRTATAIAAALMITGLTTSGVLAAGAAPKNPPPPAGYVGQWYTTPAKCSYSKAQAPGYPVMWYLILNPHHIGQPNAKKSCPTKL